MIAIGITSTEQQIFVDLAGELDADHAPRLLHRLIAVHRASEDLSIAIDGLEFIDSSGISVFLKLHDRVVSSGGDFAVSGPNPAVRRVLEIAGLLDIFGLS